MEGRGKEGEGLINFLPLKRGGLNRGFTVVTKASSSRLSKLALSKRT